jgi:hypothetical protein
MPVMSMKRSHNRTVESEGILFVQNVVEKSGCVFSRISLENDYGNDCYIEFFSDEVATSFCVFAQIKSGITYKSNSGYKIPTDKDHLEYWNNHSNPIAGIVYDSDINDAFWINISEYLINNPQVLNQKSHIINVLQEARFSLDRFDDFKNHFIEYIKKYKSYENYGRSLERFADFNNPSVCYDGLKSLYSNHRDKKATWFYIISNFSNVTAEGIHRNILGLISNYAENADIFWRKEDFQHFQSSELKKYITELVSKYFGENEIEIAAGYMREGVVRGSFAFRIFLLLEFISGIDKILQKMAFEKDMEMSDRSFIFWLSIFYAQESSVEDTLVNIDKFLTTYPLNEDNYIIEGVRETLKNQGFIQLG